MKRQINTKISASALVPGEYVNVAVNFAGFLGGDQEYEVYVDETDTMEDIEIKAINEAQWDLEVEEADEGEYVATFGGLIGYEETIFADDEDDALEQAKDLLSVSEIFTDSEDEE